LCQAKGRYVNTDVNQQAQPAATEKVLSVLIRLYSG
jgi:hypothetical protein